MRTATLIAVAVAAATALTGCTFGETEAIDPDLPAFTFTVTDVERTPGHCVFNGTDHTCHTLTVRMDNTNNRGDLPVGAHVWEADEGQGGVYGSPAVEGPDAVAAEASRTITVAFSVDEQDITLVELRYEGPRGNGTAPIPSA